MSADQNEHTQGPWEIWTKHTSIYAGPSKENKPGWISGHRQKICELDESDYYIDPGKNSSKYKVDKSRLKADCRLIAAAPELLAACAAALPEVIAYWHYSGDDKTKIALDLLNAALRAVEGES